MLGLLCGAASSPWSRPCVATKSAAEAAALGSWPRLYPPALGLAAV